MANRYWVGGSGTWDTSSTANWSASSGGASGASVPTTADDVFFDQFGFGSFTVTLNGSLACRNLQVSTGISPTFDSTGFSASLQCNGIFRLSSTTTWASNDLVTCTSTTNGTPITLNGATVACSFDFNCVVTGSYVLGSALITTGSITVTSRTFDTSSINSYSVTCSSFTSLAGPVRTINLRASTVTITGSGVAWNVESGSLTFSGSGTVSMTSASPKTFSGGNVNYSNLTLDHGGSGTLTISGSNIFNDITTTYTATGATTLTLTAGTNQSVSSFTASGTVGKILTINSSSAGTRAELQKSGGTVSVSYCSIQDNRAFGGATWQALLTNGNTDLGNNLGWTFTGPVASETATVTDVVSASATFVLPVSETLTTTDAISSVGVFTSQVGEALTATDALVVAPSSYTPRIQESATATDTVLTQGVFNAPFLDLVVASDALTASVTFVSSLSEVATTTDTFFSVVIFTSQLGETASATDVFSVAPSVYGPQIQESPTATDAVFTQGTFNVSAADSVTLLESVIGAYLWNLIVDAQNANWQSIHTSSPPARGGVSGACVCEVPVSGLSSVPLNWTIISTDVSPNWTITGT